jgi:hypothetical protein
MERITKASIVDDRPPNRSSAESEIGGVGQ